MKSTYLFRYILKYVFVFLLQLAGDVQHVANELFVDRGGFHATAATAFGSAALSSVIPLQFPNTARCETAN